MDKRVGFWLIVLSIVVALVFILASTYRDLSGLETLLFQVFVLGVGLVGSFLRGRESAREAAKQLIKPHARSAFRRLLSLYGSLSRLASAIQAARRNGEADPPQITVLDVLEAIVVEQIATADDALEDWRDIVPEEVEELHKKATKLKREGQG